MSRGSKGRPWKEELRTTWVPLIRNSVVVVCGCGVVMCGGYVWLCVVVCGGYVWLRGGCVWWLCVVVCGCGVVVCGGLCGCVRWLCGGFGVA